MRPIIPAHDAHGRFHRSRPHGPADGEESSQGRLRCRSCTAEARGRSTTSWRTAPPARHPRRTWPATPRRIVTMLPDSPDVERVLTGADGVFSAIQPGTIIIDCSSISPTAARRLAQQAQSHGARMLDAPVSGGEIGAISGTLSIMVGGDAGAFADVEADPRRDGQSRKGDPRRRLRRRADHQGLQPDGDRRHTRRRQRSVRAGDQGRRRSGQGARGAARRICRQPRPRGPRRTDPATRTTRRDSAPRCTARTCASPRRRWPRTARRRRSRRSSRNWSPRWSARGRGDMDYSALATVLFELADVKVKQP